jgi:uncharacterized membrane protein (Fun14 family)
VSLAQATGAFILGYLVAKGVRVLLTIAGFFLAILLVLQLAGYVTVNWEKVQADLGSLASALTSSSVSIDSVKDYAPGIAGLILGLLTGSGALGSLLRRGPRPPY